MTQWRITYASPQVSVPVTQSVGTTHAPDVRDAPRVYRWRVVGTCVLALAIAGCIPVTIRPEFDDAGKPKATPVTIAGTQDLQTGEFHPLYPVSDETPTPPAPFPWEAILQIALGVLGVGGLGGAGVAMRAVGKTRTALSMVCNLVDAQASAETDADVAKNKLLAQQMQEAAGVRTLIQSVRGKR